MNFMLYIRLLTAHLTDNQKMTIRWKLFKHIMHITVSFNYKIK